MGIRVIEIKLMNGDKPLKAFATVQVGDWTIYDWRIVQQNGNQAWISVPQVSWRDSKGRVRYRALLSIPGELKQPIEVAILSAWEKERQNGDNPSTP